MSEPAASLLGVSVTGNEVDLSYGSILRGRRVDDEAGQILYVPDEADDDNPVKLLSEEDWLIRGGDVATVSLISEDGSTAVLELNGRHQTFAQRETKPFVKGQTCLLYTSPSPRDS